MKLSITQIILGLLVVISFFLFIVFVTPGYYREIIIDSNGNFIGHILGLHKPNVLLGIWSFIYFALGFMVSSCGVVQCVLGKRKTTKTVLAHILAILGVLILVSLIVLIIWVEPHFKPYTEFVENVGQVTVQRDPDWIVLQASWKAVNFLLGLSILGSGIAQSLIREPVSIRK